MGSGGGDSSREHAEWMAPTLTKLLGCIDVERARGVAWALNQAIGSVSNYHEGHPTMSDFGLPRSHRIAEATGVSS